MRQAEHHMIVEGELSAPVASARLVRFHFDEPVDQRMQTSNLYRMDMCLTPRPDNARGRYPERRGARGFESLGKLFVVPAGESMQAASDGRCQQSSLLCEFDPQRVGEWLGSDLQWSDHALRAGLDIREGSLQLLLQRLAREVKEPGFASDAMVELIVGQLAIELARYGKRSVDCSPGGLAPWRLRLIDERLHEESAPPSLTELASLCGLSVRQLSRGFRASRDCSIGDHINAVRVERACEMLATDRSIKAVALTLGFASPSSFSYAFRRATGETPTEYRARLRRLH